ncbi:unnamed protein product, partial [Ectocarpus sp. 8 AP-2014]
RPCADIWEQACDMKAHEAGGTKLRRKQSLTSQQQCVWGGRYGALLYIAAVWVVPCGRKRQGRDDANILTSRLRSPSTHVGNRNTKADQGWITRTMCFCPPKTAGHPTAGSVVIFVSVSIWCWLQRAFAPYPQYAWLDKGAASTIPISPCVVSKVTRSDTR